MTQTPQSTGQSHYISSFTQTWCKHLNASHQCRRGHGLAHLNVPKVMSKASRRLIHVDSATKARRLKRVFSSWLLSSSSGAERALPAGSRLASSWGEVKHQGGSIRGGQTQGQITRPSLNIHGRRGDGRGRASSEGLLCFQRVVMSRSCC